MFFKKKKNDELEMAKKRNEELYSQYLDAVKRMKEIEDAYTKKTGLSIRSEITKVICKFSKIEMIIMQVGVTRLLGSAKTVDDIELYSGLMKKLQSFIDRMEDDGE